MQEFKRQASTRPHSSKSRLSGAVHKGLGNERDYYDCEKNVLTFRNLTEMFYEEEIMVDGRIIYYMDDFNAYSTIRLSHKPEKPTTVSLIFVRKKEQMNKIKVAFGFEDTTQEYSHPDEETIYHNVITFENRMVKEFTASEHSKIEFLDQLMDRIPEFCESKRFKQIVWEELHNRDGHIRKRTERFTNNMKRVDTISVQYMAAPLEP